METKEGQFERRGKLSSVLRVHSFTLENYVKHFPVSWHMRQEVEEEVEEGLKVGRMYFLMSKVYGKRTWSPFSVFIRSHH